MTDFATLAIKVTSEGAVKTQSDLRGVQNQATKTEKAVQRLHGMMSHLKNLLALGIGVQGMHSFIQMSDTVKSLNAQVKFVTKSVEEYNAANRELFEIAQRTRSSLEATTTLYTRSARALQEYGYSQQRILTFTETLNKAMVVGGVGAQEQASALFQLSQALGSGRLQGDEFRSISEAAPIILDVVAQYMGKTRAEIKALSSEGKITSQVLFEAITGASQNISRQFEKMPVTFGQAMQQMRNQALKFVDEFESSTGIFGAFSESVSFLAQNFDYLAVVMSAVAVGHLVKFVNKVALATLGNQKLAMSTVQAAQATRNKYAAELQLAQAEMRSLSATMQLAQSERTRYLLRQQMAVQSQRIISLHNAEAISAQQLAVAQRSASMAGRLARGAMGVLGGPVGVVTTLLFAGAGALYEWYDKAQQAREEALRYAENLNITTESLQKMSSVELSVTQDKLTRSIREQVDQLKSLRGEYEKLIQASKSPVDMEVMMASGGFYSFRKSQEEMNETLEQARAKALEVEQAEKQLAVSRDKLAQVSGYANDIERQLNETLETQGVTIQGVPPQLQRLSDSMREAGVWGSDVIPQFLAVTQAILGIGDAALSTSDNVKNLIGEKAQDIIDRSKRQMAIANATDSKQKAKLKAEDFVANMKGELTQYELEAIKAQKEMEYLAQAALGTKGGRHVAGGSTDRYADMYNDYTSKLGELKADTVSIAQYGGASLYKAYDQLMEKLKTDRETFKNMTSSQIEALKKLSQEIDNANMAKQVALYRSDKSEELEQMRFEISLIGMTASEQEKLNFERKIDNEIKKLSIGMTDEYIRKLHEEGEQIKKIRDELQGMKEVKKSDPLAGLNEGVNRFKEEATNVMGNVSDMTLRAFDGMTDALTRFVLTGTADFKSFAQSVINDITKMIIKMMIFQTIKSAGTAMGFDMSWLGGKSGGGYVYSSGGLVGFDEGGFTGLGGKYQPAGIVHKGEYVLTKEATSRLGVDYLDYLNYQSRSKPKGFAHGGGVGLPTRHLMTGRSNVSVKVINNGEPVTANVDSKQTSNGLEISVELVKMMSEIADKAANKVIQNNFRSGGAFA
ncbi:MAG: phage tail tape measure protein [[Pasteurella] mairii]|uniref:Phage-related minor tail protein n=1 Tax=[Pasteurella] mairii TaxID=757 RepID=A0A379B3W9_9PAST|nr:phage tail tape measure protein [[Pasteurella] mairii]SUB33297.1 Phage-related minor tail protein [[Pasteurella] mairii]